jgi:hypothetical protein
MSSAVSGVSTRNPMRRSFSVQRSRWAAIIASGSEFQMLKRLLLTASLVLSTFVTGAVTSPTANAATCASSAQQTVANDSAKKCRWKKGCKWCKYKKHGKWHKEWCKWWDNNGWDNNGWGW